jgi:hypothetical protein
MSGGISKRRRPPRSTKAELYALLSQLSDRECAVWVAVIERSAATKGAGLMIPAMTVTVSVDSGPTVRLAYDPSSADERVPGWKGQYEIIVPCSTVSLGQQLGAPAPTWLKDLLADAAAYLIMYASEEHHWLAELRGATASEAQEHPAREA